MTMQVETPISGKILNIKTKCISRLEGDHNFQVNNNRTYIVAKQEYICA